LQNKLEQVFFFAHHYILMQLAIHPRLQNNNDNLQRGDLKYLIKDLLIPSIIKELAHYCRV